MKAVRRWSRGKSVGLGCAFLALLGGAAAATPPTITEGVEAAASGEVSFGRTVVLPDYVVSATRIDRHPWRYGSVPGFEVLTRASEDDTCAFLDALRRGQWLEDQVLPEDWRPQAPVPYTVILDNTDPGTIRRTEMPEHPLAATSPADAFGWERPAASMHFSFFPFNGGDPDTLATNTNLYGVDVSLDRASISLERLRRCAPSLPSWLMAGLVGKQFGLFADGVLLVRGRDTNAITKQAIFRGAMWVSVDETKRLRETIEEVKKTKARHEVAAEVTIPFIPLRRLLTDSPGWDEERPLAESEAALFVRWGLFGPQKRAAQDPAMRRAFLRFVERARREPVTEAIFTECFGMGFAAMERILTAYLKDVIARPETIDLDFTRDLPALDLKPATADQIGRILGDWLRMQAESMRQQEPAMRGKFLEATERMLTRAYEIDNGLPPDAAPAPPDERTARPAPPMPAGPVVALPPLVVMADRIHDPGLLAVFGLYEHDIGDEAKARAFLEKAAKSGVARPRAHVVLSQLRYAEAIAQPSGPNRRLSAAQTGFILEPVRVALQSSFTIEAYGLMVETLARSEANPLALDLQTILDGVAQFPNNSRLALRAAQLCAQSGNVTRASELIDQSLAFVRDEDTKREFQRLRSSLSIGASIP